VFTELGIEVEICPEMLVAVQRISQESYDAILVDWDQEADAIRLLKAVREQKTTSQALNLALVQNDKDLPRALQHGANSAIRKPIDPRQAKDTLSTARELILSRRSEQKTKEERAAAAQAAIAAAAAEVPLNDDGPPVPKTGFLVQTAPRSAFEAAESAGPQDSPIEPPSQQAAQLSAKLQEADSELEAPQPTLKRRWDDKPKPQPAPSVEAAESESQRSQDSTGVFSSLTEKEIPDVVPDPSSKMVEQSRRPQYLVFALAGCVLIAGILWVCAPGDSYLGGISSWFHSLSRSAPAAASQAVTAITNAPSTVLEQSPPPAAEPPSAPENVPASTDPGPIESSEVDPGNLQVIETKSIPKPGAQQPPSTDAPPEQVPARPESTAPSETPAPPVPTTAPAQVPQQPAFVPIASPQPRPTVSVRENSTPAPSQRSGVIIPDSLKAAPAQAPVNSVDSGVVPEEVSRALVVNRVEPVYPAQALPQHLEGAVILQVWVARDGAVQDVKLIRGNFALARAAFDAVRQWRFKPYSPNGRPVDFQTVVTLSFKYPG